MVGLPTRPCEPWAAEFPCSGVPQSTDDEILAANLMVATEVLWALSGRRYGTCTETVRPCRREPAGRLDARIWVAPEMWSWPRAWSYACGRCSGECGCAATPSIVLWRRPVTAILDVVVDGETLTADAYRLDDHRRLVRTDGEQWPTSQDPDAPDGSPGTWSVSYRWGTPPPTAGVAAVQTLACELTRGQLGLDCALPERVTSVSRQGISYTISDPTSLLDKGRTGIYTVDLFLAAVNPNGNKRPPMLLRADAPRRPARRL
jgi:hypothetical protein